jgi:hypothetical protein
VKLEYISSNSLALTNAGFESGTLYQPPVQGWTYGTNESGGVFKEDRYGHSEGSYTASFNQSGWIYQDSGHALLANRTYVLSVDLKQYGGADYPGDVVLELRAGASYGSSTVLAHTKIGSGTITTSWDTYSLTYNSPASGSVIGQRVWVRIIQLQAAPNRYEFVFLDNVRFAYHDPERKLITGSTVGWKFPGNLLNELDDLQDLPFDGIDVYTNYGDATFATSLTYNYNNSGGSEGEDGSVEQMQNIVNGELWGRFTDNFMHMTVSENIDWYDDTNWADVLKKVKAVARIGAAGGAKGIMFDPEGHSAGHVPWEYNYQVQNGTYSYSQMKAKVRARGVEFIDTVEHYMSNPTFLTLFWASFLRDRHFDTQNDVYGLYTAFMLGVLEGADAGTHIIDGDELSYYSDTYAEFATGNVKVLSDAITTGLIPSGDQAKYRQKVTPGHAVWDSDAAVPDAYEMKYHHIYYGLMNSFNYAWFYTEGTRQYLNHQGIRPGMIEAIQQGKAWAIEDANR